MKNALSAFSRTTSGKLSAVALLTVAGIGSANAALDPAAQAAFDGVLTSGTDMAAAAWPVVAGIVGSLVAIGLFKKFANKAS